MHTCTKEGIYWPRLVGRQARPASDKSSLFTYDCILAPCRKKTIRKNNVKAAGHPARDMPWLQLVALLCWLS